MKLKLNSKITVVVGLILIVSAVTFFGTGGKWLSADIFTEKNVKKADNQLTKLRNAFQLKMDNFLEKYRPGKFNQKECRPVKGEAGVLAKQLMEATEKAWGLDKETTKSIDRFESIGSVKDRWNYINEYLEGDRKKDLISFQLYESFLQGYFIKYGNTLSLNKKLEQKKEAGDPNPTLAITELYADYQNLSSMSENERVSAEIALDAAFVFLVEEYRAATIISGLCELLESSDKFRLTLEDLRAKIGEVFPHTGDYKIN